MIEVRMGYPGPGVQLHGRVHGAGAEVVGNTLHVDGIEVRVTEDADGGLMIWATWPAAPAWSTSVERR